MRQDMLTLEGMRQGVRDSDVFLPPRRDSDPPGTVLGAQKIFLYLRGCTSNRPEVIPKVF
jgi:hypothetical protein